MTLSTSQSSHTFTYLMVGLVIFFIAGLVFLKSKPAPTPAGAAELAACLKTSGTIFYGASWCSHCKAQKDLFGGAAEQLPYIECAAGDDMKPECTAAGVEGFPTWINKQGEKLVGEQSFETLATFSGCTEALTKK